MTTPRDDDWITDEIAQEIEDSVAAMEANPRPRSFDDVEDFLRELRQD